MKEKPKPQHKLAKSDVNKLNTLPVTVYFFRVTGMGFGGLAAGMVLYENQAPLWSWLWLVISCYVWPHLAFLRAKNNNKSPFQAEQHNLLIDSFIAGNSIAVIHFNLLPSVLLLVIATADKVNSGIPKLWLKGIVLSLLGMVVAGLFTGFTVQAHTSMKVIIACIPVAVIHTILVSVYSFKLINKLQQQNRRLNKLSQEDSLTGVLNRRHWQHLSEQLLESNTQAASLLLIDVDHFKEINDRFGHVAGDDVLCEVAKLIQQNTSSDAFIGRLGGDEFAVVIHATIDQVTPMAENIKHAINNISLPQYANLKCTTSIGMADINSAKGSIRSWLESADRMLYQAKSSGRNCIAH